MSQLPPTFVKGFHDEESVRKMRYNRLGQTDLIVSGLSIGGATLTHFFGEVDEEEGIRTIREAIRLGINYIDTSPWYGQGRSEQLLGKALKGVPREAYYIATKVGRYELELSKQFDFSAEKSLQSVNTSLKYLELDYVDIIQVHDVEFAESTDIVVNETIPALEKVVKQGLARYIGITGYPLNVLKDIILRVPGRVHTVLSYARYHLVDNTLEKYLSFFEEQKIGVICAAGLAMGLLTNGGPQKWHPADDNIKERCRKAAEYCEEKGIELAKLAMYYFSQLKGPATFLVGMQTKELLSKNWDTYLHGLQANEHEALDYLLKQYFAEKAHWEGKELKKKFNR